MLNLVRLSSYLLITTMKSISAEKHSSVVSLLNEGYSHCQIQARMGLGKGTIGRISREVEGDKENHPGDHPKLSPCDKQSIIHQIRSGKLDNAIQATQFINSTISNSVTPQTVRNILKEAGFRSATKKKVPMLKGSHHQQHLKFAQYHEIGLWRTGRRCCGLMRQKSIGLGQMGRCMFGSNKGNQQQTGQPH